MRALRLGDTIWVDVVLYGLAGPITGVAYDDENLRVEQRFCADSEFEDFVLTEDKWLEVGDGVYRLKLGPMDESWDAPYLYWRVVYTGEVGVSVVDCGVIAHADTIAPLDGYALSQAIAEYLSGIIAGVDNWHYGYIREHISHKLLPAVDVAVNDWRSEDAAGYRRWTGELTIRVSAADGKRATAEQTVSNLSADIITILQEANVESIPVDAVRDVRLSFGELPDSKAVRLAEIKANMIMEV